MNKDNQLRVLKLVTTIFTLVCFAFSFVMLINITKDISEAPKEPVVVVTEIGTVIKINTRMVHGNSYVSSVLVQYDDGEVEKITRCSLGLSYSLYVGCDVEIQNKKITKVLNMREKE